MTEYKREELPWHVPCSHCGRNAIGYLPYVDPDNPYREVAETVCRHCGAADILIYNSTAFINNEPYMKRIYWPPVKQKTPFWRRKDVDEKNWHF